MKRDGSVFCAPRYQRRGLGCRVARCCGRKEKKMTTKILTAFVLFLALGAAAMADSEAPNEPAVVRSSEYGQTYARSVPDEHYGQKGMTRVFRVGRDSDELLCEYDWHAAEIYLGGPGEETLVRFGPWQCGRQPQGDHLAIGIYRDGKTIREYSTLDMQKLGSGYSPSQSHYVVFQRRIGFLWTGGDSCVYEVEGVSGKVFTFDLDTGDVEEKTAAQPPGGGAKVKPLHLVSAVNVGDKSWQKKEERR